MTSVGMFRRGLSGCGVATALAASSVDARTGTHGISIQSWDTRASHVSAGPTFGVAKGGGRLDVWGVSGGFAASSGNVSVEFGIYSLRFRPTKTDSNENGVSSTAVGLVALPVAPRLENGVPGMAVALYFGLAPAALVSGASSSLAIPAVLGGGVPISEERATLTPWIEAAPTLNLDPTFNAVSPPAPTIDPTTGQATVSRQQVLDLVDRAAGHRLSFGIGLRYGLTAEMRLLDDVDFRLLAGGSYLGVAFQSPAMLDVGIGSTWRWDRVVSAVLPPEQQALREDCVAIESRFAECPLYRRLIDQREVARLAAERARDACTDDRAKDPNPRR